ncbi:MAG: hypothetical protein ACYC9O_14445 [Candidatus Latescibacterota bacterium]
MKKFSFMKMAGICGFLIASSCGVMRNPPAPPTMDYEYLSPVSVVADKSGKTLYIAEATARRITVFDTDSNTVTGAIMLKNNPGGLAIAPDGSRLYVASGLSDGIIEIVDLDTRRVVKSIRAGHTPCSPAPGPDGKKLFVCNRFDNNVSVIDLVSSRTIERVPMFREPIAAALTPDGKYLFVANHLPSGRVLYDYVRDAQIMMIGSYQSQGAYGGKKMDYAATGVILAVDTTTYRLVELIPLRDGATGLRGICVSPDGRNVYVTHVLANYKVPAEHIARGGINANALSIIDVPGLRLLNTVLLDDADRGAANPWDVKCSPDGKYICVTHAGTHEISVIDRAGLHKKLEATNKKSLAGVSSATDTLKDITFLEGLGRRFPLIGDGPRGMAMVGTKIYAAEYFSDSIGIIDYESPNKISHQSVALGPPKKLSETRRGELLFNDARICFQGWQSCASCHPEGRSDALNWDLLNDGAGNPKKTKSLLLSHRTPPSMITGIRADAETAVRAGLQYIHFTKQPEETATAIDAYLKSMQPVPSPYLQKGKLSESAKRGKKIFQKAGCAECHTPPHYTDGKKYDVGLGIGPEINGAFDTPTLIEVWRNAPYLYDGRAELMHEVFMYFNGTGKHGATSKINKIYLYDLAEYVLSL